MPIGCGFEKTGSQLACVRQGLGRAAKYHCLWSQDPAFAHCAAYLAKAGAGTALKDKQGKTAADLSSDEAIRCVFASVK